MRIETRAVHAGRRIDSATGAVTAPIHLSTTFERSPDGTYPLGYSYSREDNPNRQALEQCLAELEGGKQALCFSSGLAVVTALVQGLEPGDHIVAPEIAPAVERFNPVEAIATVPEPPPIDTAPKQAMRSGP